VHTYERWHEAATKAGLAVAGSGSEIVAGLERPGGAEPSVAERALAFGEAIEAFGADVVVSDALTLSPALAAERAGVPRALLLPQVYPVNDPGLPPFSLGLRPPRTALGTAGWRLVAPVAGTGLPTTRWLRASRANLDEQRRRIGLGPARSRHGLEPDALVLVATLPALEYPRRWPDGVHVTGPMLFDAAAGPAPPLPPGDEPLIVVAPSTVKDPAGKLAAAVVAATAGATVRLAISTGGAPPPPGAPPGALVAEWLDYGAAMSAAALVVCHGNHGAITHSLAAGAPLVINPAMPDDTEHGARVAWAGAGVMVRRRVHLPGALGRAIERVLADRRFGARAAELAAWCAAHDGATRGAELVERHARR
jgi:UDP:flavonoid glycosyltransferase YjiC (YdhE family)